MIRVSVAKLTAAKHVFTQPGLANLASKIRRFCIADFAGLDLTREVDGYIYLGQQAPAF
jgi:hypothetical protein